MKNSKTFSIISLCCSIVSWLIFWWLAFVGLTLGIVALTDNEKTSGTKAMSIISIVIAAIGLIIFFIGIGAGA